MVWIPGVDEKPFGIWRTKPGEFRITVSAVGEFSRKKHKLQVGDKVGIRGPFGRGFTIPEKRRRVVLIGGGFGVAPLLGLIERIKNRHVELVIGARSQKFLFGEQYAKKMGAQVSITTDDGSCGLKCFATHLLAETLSKKRTDFVYSCGPELMMLHVAKISHRANVPCELSLERFMKCGIGVCGSCTMDDTGFCVCKDGPIIEGEKALKLIEFGKYRRDSVGVRKNF